MASLAPHRVKPNVTPYGCPDRAKTAQHRQAITPVASISL
jgi:hypothetical protein